MKGQVADAFGDLITKLHYGSSSSYSPSDFKRTLARFAPSFSGYQQHDSQEFITFLLDGLHEDLNRIKKKPYVESPDWNGGGEAELAHLAKVCWDNYKKRNDSVIVDLFQGQYKSCVALCSRPALVCGSARVLTSPYFSPARTLVCPKCSKVSITFDPFMYLTLPVPVKKKMEVEVFYVPATGKRFKVTLSVPKDASFRAVKQLIGQWFEKDPVTIFAAELWHGYFYKMFGDHDMIGEIASGDVIVFYEVATKLKTRHVVRTEDAPDANIRFRSHTDPSSFKLVQSTLPADPDMFVIPVFTARAGARSENRYSNNSDGLVGAPFFVTVSRAEAASVDAITQAVVSQYARLLKDGDEGTLVTAAGPTDVSSGSDNTEDAIGEDDPDTLVTEIPLDPSLAAPSPPVADILFDDMATDSPPSSSVSASMTIATPSESTSPSSLPSEAVAGPSSRPVFTISVFSPRHRYGSVAGQIPDGKDLGGELFPLGTAYGNRSAARRLDTPDSDDELATAPTAAPIYLGPGTGIVCTWPDGVLDETLGPKSASAFDMGYETFVDPSIVAEAGKKRTKATLSIDDCLDEFSREETLGDDDLWYCSTVRAGFLAFCSTGQLPADGLLFRRLQCKEHQAATKKLELWKTPDILVVHLKRFGGSRGLRDKIDNLIEFPVTDFDLSPRVQERQIALSIEAAGGSTNDLGLESTKEPVVYDLCASSSLVPLLGCFH
jgi:ubiquitin carboxyl-terminal hydrolase 4/11/15